MSTRRSFLKLLGIAPAAAVSQSTPASLAGIGGMLGGGGYPPSVEAVRPVEEGFEALQDIAEEKAHKMFFTALKGEGALPNYVMDTILIDNREVHNLEPDLAVNRSFSLSAKVHIQRQRNVQKSIESLVNGGDRKLRRRAFRKLHGFDIY